MLRDQAITSCANLRNEIIKLIDENDPNSIEAVDNLNAKKTTKLISSSTGGYNINHDLMLRRWGMTLRADQYRQKHQNKTKPNSLWIFHKNIKNMAMLQSLQQQLQYTTIDILYSDPMEWVNKMKLTATDFYSPKSNTHHLHQIILTALFVFFLHNVIQLYPTLCAL